MAKCAWCGKTFQPIWFEKYCSNRCKSEAKNDGGFDGNNKSKKGCLKWMIGIILLVIILSLIINKSSDKFSKPAEYIPESSVEIFESSENILKLSAESPKLGIWAIKYFADDFGEPTKERYITTTKPISGKYSIFSSNNLDMQVYFIIVNEESVAIKFEDWSGSMLSKGGYLVSFRVLVQDSEGERYTLSASNNNSDILLFSYSEAKKVYDILLKGGTVKFKIYSDDILNYEYSFTIDNADGLENAYNKLTGSSNTQKKNSSNNLITSTSIAGVEVIDKTVKDVKPYFDKELIWEYVDNYEEMYLVKKGRTVVFEFYTERKVIVGASVLDPTFVTADGFHVGSTSGDILKKYPKATVYSTEYDGELTEINGIAYFYADEPVSNIDEDFAEGEILNKNVKITSIVIRGNR